MSDEMIIRIPLSWPVSLRQDVEERLQRAMLAEKLLLTEIGTQSNRGVQERWLFFGQKKQ